jgi:branched-chain amino acid transport system substrate-binding protein
VGALVSAAPAGAAKSKLPATITIGSPLDLSGIPSVASVGQSEQQGIDVAVKEINSTKFLGKSKLTVDYFDTKTEKNASVEAALKFASSKPAAVIGWTLSANYLAAAPNLQAAKVPSVGVMLSGAGVTEVGDYMFRTMPELGPKFAAADVELAKAIGAKTAAYLTESTNASAVAITPIRKAALEKIGVKTVAEQTMLGTATDVRAQLTEFKNAKPDMIVVNQSSGQIPIVALQAQELGIKTQWDIGTGTSDAYLQQAGAALQCTVWFDPWSRAALDLGNNKHFLEYWAVNGPNKVPDSFSALGYSATWAVAEAIKSAGSTDGTAVRDALVKLKNIETPVGVITYGKLRDPQLPGVVLQVRDGAIVPWDKKPCVQKS